MGNLPSITTTYMRAFALYFKSYLPVLPFTLMAVILAFFINEILPIPIGTAHLNGTQYANLALQLIVSLLFFSLILYGCYLKQNNLKFDYLDIFITVIKHLASVVLSFILIILPMLICFFISSELIGPTPHPGDPVSSAAAIYLIAFSILILIVAIATIIFACYFYVSTFEIVVKGKGPIGGLVRSWQLIRGHWFKTFFILVLFIVPIMVLSFILVSLIGNIAGPLINLVFYPFGTSLMVIFHEQLEKNSQAVVKIPEKN